MSDGLLTAREVAERLGVSTGALLRWARAGQVPALKLPSGAIRFRPEAVEAWLAERATGAAQREVSATHGNRARRAGGYSRLLFDASATPPHEAATSEKEL